MSVMLEGRIHSGVGGTFAVVTQEGALACRARGLFRKQGITPLVGDRVRAERIGEKEGYILEILPRDNALVRPPLANLDQLFLLCSMVKPRPNLRLLDTLIAMAELSGIAPVVVFTKCDLADGSEYAEIYKAFTCFTLGFDAGSMNAAPTGDLEGIRALFQGKTSAFCGNTGVGKSTLLNRIAPELALPTGEISDKLGRGRHTTRHVELYPAAGGWVADTPGFSALDFVTPSPASRELPQGGARNALTKDNLALGFREFAPFIGKCKFQDCAHVKDGGCAVAAAAETNEIPGTRWESYCSIYDELKKRKDWEA